MYKMHYTTSTGKYVGGQYSSVGEAIFKARRLAKRVKCAWAVVRLSDGVVLAQSKAAQL